MAAKEGWEVACLAFELFSDQGPMHRWRAVYEACRKHALEEVKDDWIALGATADALQRAREVLDRERTELSPRVLADREQLDRRRLETVTKLQEKAYDIRCDITAHRDITRNLVQLQVLLDTLARQFEQRDGTPIVLSRTEYEELVARAAGFLASHKEKKGSGPEGTPAP